MNQERNDLKTEILSVQNAIKTPGFQQDLDTDQLQAELDMIIGSTDTTAHQFKELESEIALKKLKDKMNKE